jgi:ABC-type arginine transport system ATPase subunit
MTITAPLFRSGLKTSAYITTRFRHLKAYRSKYPKAKSSPSSEPTEPKNPLIAKEIFSAVKKLNESGTTVLLVEQNGKAFRNVAQRAFVLETGEIVLEGLAVDLLDNPKAKEAYPSG